MCLPAFLCKVACILCLPPVLSPSPSPEVGRTAKGMGTGTSDGRERKVGTVAASDGRVARDRYAGYALSGEPGEMQVA